MAHQPAFFEPGQRLGVAEVFLDVKETDRQRLQPQAF